jgi:hypothetical protein
MLADDHWNGEACQVRKVPERKPLAEGGPRRRAGGDLRKRERHVERAPGRLDYSKHSQKGRFQHLHSRGKDILEPEYINTLYKDKKRCYSKKRCTRRLLVAVFGGSEQGARGRTYLGDGRLGQLPRRGWEDEPEYRTPCSQRIVYSHAATTTSDPHLGPTTATCP